MDYYKKEAANLIVAMGKDKAFEFAWWNIEVNTPTGPMAAAYWTDVAKCIDPAMFDQVSKEAALRKEG